MAAQAQRFGAGIGIRGIAGTHAGKSGLGCGGSSQFSAVTVLVRGLPHNATEADVRRFFARESLDVVKATVCCDPETWRCKGYAFADFANHDEAYHAVQKLSGVVLGGCHITVEIKEPTGAASQRVRNGGHDSAGARAYAESGNYGGAGGKAGFGVVGKGQGYWTQSKMGK
mmetsp:Transcript_70269/g.195579  ORF Transcript_70269/g.195579 Transcript_70269/m.195579 type:complete len:171 (+) Transcript_70269:57-569(+)